ncbi:MAG: lactate utilization protein [Lentisphaeria bacterium]|nr:lactate utilization protein [Candidatus Neomarinimicrobiota bacterium]MCF7841847.1 lactate utilization protein [Lentisphaeria bacterium]
MEFTPRSIKANFTESLKDFTLRKNLTKATHHTIEKRDALKAAAPDWNKWRDAAAASRRESLLHLDRYLAQFENQFTALGGEVVHATTIEDARSKILDIIKAENGRTVVKAKSMVTEELELATFLNAQDIETWETDLGEFIIQLAGEHPSHITAPAIHKNRQQIAQLLHEKMGVPYTEDPELLTGYARQFLRQKYLDADVGISGGNFIIAETGQVILVENEANIRLSTVLPRIHIAVTGVEKVVPSQQDYANLMRLLPASATGQKMAGYVSALTPGVSGGPERMIVILLDAGRRQMLASEKWEMLACIRCGACLNVCPIFNRGGGHAYGSVYPGPMGSILTPGLSEPGNAPDHAFASSLCGACVDICPVKIPLTKLLLQTRGDVVNTHHKSWDNLAERSVWKSWSLMMRHPGIFRIMRWFGARIPVRFHWGSDARKLPRLAKETFLQQVRDGRFD